MNKTYYMVHREGTYTRVVHETKGEAIGEACRLARNHPGESFTVLEAVMMVRQPPAKLEIEEIDKGRKDDGIPF